MIPSLSFNFFSNSWFSIWIGLKLLSWLILGLIPRGTCPRLCHGWWARSSRCPSWSRSYWPRMSTVIHLVGRLQFWVSWNTRSGTQASWCRFSYAVSPSWLILYSFTVWALSCRLNYDLGTCGLRFFELFPTLLKSVLLRIVWTLKVLFEQSVFGQFHQGVYFMNVDVFDVSLILVEIGVYGRVCRHMINLY